MVGAELAVGYLFAWLVRKAKRAGERADEHVDAALDAGVDQLSAKLHELVSGRLHGDPALERLSGEARKALESPSPRVATRVALALEDAAGEDEQFGADVEELVRRIQAVERPVKAVGGVAVGGDITVHARGGSVALGVVQGDVSLGNPPVPATGQAQP